MSDGVVVLLVGPSSSGKTSAARALQVLTSRPAFLLSPDDLEFPEHSRAIERLQTLDDAGQAAWRLTVYEAYFAALVAVAQSGVHAIGEANIRERTQLDLVQDLVTSCDARIVRLSVNADVALARERSRGDRVAGLHLRTAAEALNHELPLSLDLDTTSMTPDQIARSVLDLLEASDTGWSSSN